MRSPIVKHIWLWWNSALNVRNSHPHIPGTLLPASAGFFRSHSVNEGRSTSGNRRHICGRVSDVCAKIRLRHHLYKRMYKRLQDTLRAQLIVVLWGVCWCCLWLGVYPKWEHRIRCHCGSSSWSCSSRVRTTTALHGRVVRSVNSRFVVISFFLWPRFLSLFVYQWNFNKLFMVLRLFLKYSVHFSSALSMDELS